MNKYSLLVISLLLIFSELLIRLFEVPNYLLPLPSEVLTTLWVSKNDLALALWETSQHTLFGLSLSFIGGMALSLLISLSPWLRAGILPLALFFQTVPIVAIAPMLVIWFGFGGPTVIAAAAIVSFFPIMASTLQGLESTPKSALELFQLYRSNKWNLYKKLKIPYAIPWIYNGLRIAMGLGVVGSIVGEFIGGGGLGSLIDSARTQQRTDLVFAAVLTSCVLGWSLTLLLDFSRKTFLKNWIPTDQT